MGEVSNKQLLGQNQNQQSLFKIKRS